MKYESLVRRLAHKSSYPFRLGAVVVKGGRVVSSGYNKSCSHPWVERLNEICSTFKHSIHAEIDALLRAPEGQLEGATLYVGRIQKSGTFGLARPCPICVEACRIKGIKRVIFSIDDDCYGVLELKKKNSKIKQTRSYQVAC